MSSIYIVHQTYFITILVTLIFYLYNKLCFWEIACR